MVDRCVCSGVTFAEVLRLHREEGLSYAQIRERTDVCRGCSLCRPYVRLTLSTGRVSHPVLTEREAAEAMRAPC